MCSHLHSRHWWRFHAVVMSQMLLLAVGEGGGVNANGRAKLV